MQIRIPHVTKKDEVQALKNCIEKAAGRSGVDEYGGTMFLTHFFEALADELTKGRCVMFPGFGLFAPVRSNPRQGMCIPCFSPARGFRQQVMYGAPPGEENVRRYMNHRRGHHPSTHPGQQDSRVFSAQEKIRKSLAAQLSHARDEDEVQ